MSVQIFGFHGNVGSGKDTSAGFIEYTDRFAFAEPLKSASCHLFNLSEKQVYDEQEKNVVDVRWNKTPRELLQFLGTDLLRNRFDKEIFVKNMKYRIQDVIEEVARRTLLNKVTNEPNNKDHRVIVVTDVRFDNEAQLIRSLGGRIIRVERPGYSVKLTKPQANSWWWTRVFYYLKKKVYTFFDFKHLLLENGQSIHASEVPISPHLIDYVIENDKGLVDLKYKVQQMAESAYSSVTNV